MSAEQYKARCCVVGCTNTMNNTPGLRFYRFPNATIYSYKQKRRNDWIAAVKRKNPNGSNWQPYTNTRICSKHFVGNQKSEDPRSPSYNPTIFPTVYHKSTICEQSAIDRYERAKKRRSDGTPQQSSIDSKHIKCTTTASEENILNDIKHNEFEGRAKTFILDHQKKIHQGVQVNFLEEKSSRLDRESFTCNRYIYVNSNTNKYRSTCDVELQIYIPECTTIRRIIIEKPKTVNRSFGNCIICENKSVGPEAEKRDIDSSLKRTTRFLGVISIKDDHQMLNLAGVTLTVFQLLLKILPEAREKIISKENRLLLFLFKMKNGLSYSALSVLFGIHKSSAMRIFTSTLQCLALGTKQFVSWPSREIIQATMPEAFKETYKNCRVIIDCMEFRQKQPPSFDARVNLYSHSKKDLTVKVLVGCTPSGAISFISKCHGGRTTDTKIARNSGFLELLEPNDVVLADNRFSQIKTKLDESGRGVLLAIPSVLGNNNFCTEKVEEICTVASVRKYIERRLRTYRILDKFTAKMLSYCDDIVLVCCALVNLQLIYRH